MPTRRPISQIAEPGRPERAGGPTGFEQAALRKVQPEPPEVTILIF